MTRIINGERRYGVWGGCPVVSAEDPTRCTEAVWQRENAWYPHPHCTEEVWQRENAWYPHQCSRRRGHGPDGLYCKQHAKKHNMEAQ